MADTSTDPGGAGAPQAAHAALTILAVDDDADVLRATQRILVEAGFQVLTGATAAEALELTQRHRPALVLLDVMLPDGNGVDAARQIKGDPALSDVFVILCSGVKTSADDQARGLAQGLADGYVTRPFSKPELLAQIDALLRIRETQRALRESEERFRALIEWTPEAIVVHRGGKLIYVNPAAITMFGATSAEDLVGKPILDLIHPDCHQIVLDRVEKALDTNVGAPPIELRYCKLDGTIIEAEVQGTPLVYDGEPAIHVALRDITARKRAQEALRESEERFRTMFVGSRDAMMTLAAPSWRFTAGNPAALEMFGAKDAAELTALGPWDVSPERQPDGSLSAGRSSEAIEAALREGSHFFEWTFRRVGGAEFPCTVLLTRIEIAGQTFVQSTVRDVTAQKQAEEALREREVIFRSIVEQAVDSVGLVDVASGRFIEFNDAACRNLGYSRDELAALGLADIDLQWPGEGMVQRLADLHAKGADAFETQHRRKDGEIRDVRVSAAVIEVAGRPCLAAIWSDITESKLAHEELARHRQRLEELVAARTDELRAANRVLAAGAADLARSRQNFDTFFNTIDDLLFVLDGDGNMIHVNETVCRRLGYTEDELLGRPVLDVHPPARRDEAGRVVAAMLAGEADFCPVPAVAKDGAEIPVETRVVPGVWDGRPALFAVTKDVSALRVSEDKFQRLFHRNPALMAVSSMPGRRFTEVNDAFLSTLGYAREEVLGHTTDELDLFVEPEQQRAVADQLEAQGRVNDCELKVRCKDGAILDGLFSGEIIESQGKQYFLTVMIDQTERRQAEEALRRREEQLASAVEGSGIGLWDWYPQTGEETFSERWAEIAGATLAELAPTSIETWRDLCHPDDLRRADELLEEHFAGHSGIYECETRMRHKDGHWVWALDRGKVSQWGSDGRPLRMTGTELDITDRKQAGDDLLESLATQQSITEGVIVALARSVEVRDPYTAGHQRRVSELATAMTLHMGLGGERAEGVRVGGMLHDVGKITIPAEILSKPGLLSLMEFGLIKGHAQSGFEILAAIRFPWPVAEMALQHHERPDGSGYPRGLEGEQILLEARILAVADVVEAMASHRPYRPALGLDAALAEVRSGAGVRYDADAVAACENVFAQGFVFSEA